MFLPCSSLRFRFKSKCLFSTMFLPCHIIYAYIIYAYIIGHQNLLYISEDVLFNASNGISFSTASPPPPTPPQFMRNIAENVARGLHIINLKSGCTIAVWIYRGIRRNVTALEDDCRMAQSQKKLFTLEDAAKIQTNDTVYVPFVFLNEFATTFLPAIPHKFVLIAAQFQASSPPSETSTRLILESPKVLKYLLIDPTMYAASGGLHSHEKVGPFPKGLKPIRHGLRRKALNPIPHFRKAFLEHLSTTKTTHVYASHLANTHESRKAIPTGKALDYPDYLAKVASSWYVLSPRGIRPDCHRNYESLGLGAVPITDLDPNYYAHLKMGPVLYNNTEWDMDYLRATLPLRSVPANRIMVFEEYWMAYMEQVVGRQLRWWDVLAHEPRHLSEFEPGNSDEVVQKILGRPVSLE